MKNTKLNRINQKIESAELLKNNGFHLDAVNLFWQATRDYIFLWLTRNNFSFDSSVEALKLISKNVDSKLRAKILQIEITGTLAEWDENFLITESQTSDLKKTCLLILEELDYDKD